MSTTLEAEPATTEDKVVIPPPKTFPERMEIIADAIVNDWKYQDLEQLRRWQRTALGAYLQLCVGDTTEESTNPYKKELPQDLDAGEIIFKGALKKLTSQQ
jgi:hypothetical protein